jgi:tetratricopeptide (TPR) repeat protein
MKVKSIILRIAGLAAPILLASQLGAMAQVSTPEQQGTLARMSADPTDHENTFAYVRASVAVRDYEAAIAALERLVLYNPDLSRAKFELGVLYFRMKSFHQAVNYFEEAASDPALDPNLRNRLEGFLPEARKKTEKSQFSGILQLGFRYNSNMDSSTGFNRVRVLGGNALAQSPFAETPDTSVFALASLDHVLDFQNARGDRWETAFNGYVSRPLKLTDLNVAVLDLSTGPRFGLDLDVFPGMTIRPSIDLGMSFYNGSRIALSYGGGVSAAIPLSQNAALDFGVSYRMLDVGNAKFPGINRSQFSTGTVIGGYVGTTWAITDSISLSGKAFYDVNRASNAAKGINSHHTGIQAQMKFNFDPPMQSIGYRWSATPFVRYSSSFYEKPDPAIDPIIKRNDQQLRVGLQLDAPMTALFGVSGTVQYTNNLSNLPNYRSSSWSVMVGPTMRF